MFKINLVPEVQEKKNQVQKMNATSVTVAVVIMSVTIVALILISLARATINFQLASVEKNIEKVNKESEQYKELEETVVSLEKGLAGIKEIYDGKNQWISLLTHLEAATPTDVTYKSLKIGAGLAEASIEAKSVDALGKAVDSYKEYKVLTLTGTNIPNKDLVITLDNVRYGTVKVKSTGTWVAAVKADLSTNHEVKVGEGETYATVTYTAEDSKIEGTDGAMGVIKNLFNTVESTGYQKNDAGKLTTVIKFNYDGGALW